MYNGILLFRKPQGFTSHDVVAKLRGILRQRRIGHAGTLDPMAEGLLVILLGSATKASDDAASSGKTYIAGLRLGLVTDTRDIWGNTLESRPHAVTRQDLEAVLPRFRGQISQKPPMYSAVKIGGQKLYSMARKGVEIDPPAREIFIDKLEITGQRAEDFLLKIVCSKGTYVRSLCHDIGRALECGGCMSSLERIKSGEFSIENALGFVEVEHLHKSGNLQQNLTPVARVYAKFAEIGLNEAGEIRAKNGASIDKSHISRGKFPEIAGERVRVYSREGGFLMTALSREQAGAIVLGCDKNFAAAEGRA